MRAGLWTNCRSTWFGDGDRPAGSGGHHSQHLCHAKCEIYSLEIVLCDQEEVRFVHSLENVGCLSVGVRAGDWPLGLVQSLRFFAEATEELDSTTCPGCLPSCYYSRRNTARWRSRTRGSSATWKSGAAVWRPRRTPRTGRGRTSGNA